MDTIYLRDIALSARIGVYDWEQQIDQKLILSLELQGTWSNAAEQDDLSKSVDYGAVLQRVREHVLHSRVKLIETLAVQLANLILNEFPVHAVKVDIAKVYIFADVPRIGIVIERSR